MKIKAGLSLLALALSPTVNAALFITIQSGDWGDPNTWVGAAGFPQTYTGGDSADIDPGHVVAYDGSASAALGGNLIVAGSQNITIDGGTLSQTWLPGAVPPFGTAIAIGVTHPVSGIGSLDVLNGGLFDSGTANVVVVGVSNPALGAGEGDGTVNLHDGVFLLNAGAGAGGVGALGLAVGIDELAKGEFNVGDGIGTAGSAILDLASNNALLTVGGVSTTAVGGNGTVNILSDGALTFGSEAINLGESGGLGAMNIRGSLTGSGSAAVRVGRDGGGTLTINDVGANVSVGPLHVGTSAGGNGTLGMSAGTVAMTQLSVAGSESGGGVGQATISGTANVTINPGGGQSTVADNLGSMGTLDIDGVTVNNVSGQDWQMGTHGGMAVVNITNGGKLNTNWWVNVARNEGTPGTMGTVTVDGTGSEINVARLAPEDNGDIHLNIGEEGTGTLEVRNSGKVTHNGADPYRTWIGRSAGSNGTLNANTGGSFHATELFVGGNGGATGTVNIANGGLVTAQNWMSVGQGGGAIGTINIDGVGSELESRSPLLGRNGTNGGDTNIGQAGGMGIVNVTNGGRMDIGWWLLLGRDGGSEGRVTIDGATGPSNLSVGGPNVDSRLAVGAQGIGTLSVLNGGTVTADTNDFGIGVGVDGGSQGTMNVATGGRVTNDGWVTVGNGGGSNGILNISDAGSLVEAGTPAGPNHEGRFITGRFGSGLVNQSGGVARADNWFAMGLDPGAQGTYNLSGGTIELAHVNYGDRNIIVANRGAATMTITHGTPAGDTIIAAPAVPDGTYGNTINQFNVGADGHIITDPDAGDFGVEYAGNGTLEINLNDPAGVIVHRELYAGWARDGATSTQGTINIRKGTLRTDGWVEIGRGQVNSGGSGTVNVDGPQARWERGTLAPSTDGDRGPRDMNLGQGENPNLGKGYLNVTNGGTVNHNWWINLARQPGSEGHIRVDGVGSTINMVDPDAVRPGGDRNSQLNVGQAGVGTLEITDGGVFNHSMDHGGGEVWIARDAGAMGTMTVAGGGAEFNSKGREFRIAGNDLGMGTLNILDGGVVNFISTRENGVPADGNFGLAENNDSLAEINMNKGTLNVSAWSLFSAWNQSAAEARITMVDSTINIFDTPYVDGGGNVGNGGHLFWGDAGTATINQDGGLINAQGWSAIGRERGGDAFYNMTNGAMMTVGGLGGNELYVGRQSHGTITMGPGTSISVVGLMSLAQEVSPTTPSSGTVNNSGGSLAVGGEFNVGRNGVPENVGIYNQSAGSLSVGGDAFVGRDSTQGTFLITGGTAQVNSNLFVGGSGVGLARIDTVATVLGGVTVGVNGTLAGSGMVNSTSGITVQAGGTVSPGTSPGTLTLLPSLTLDGGSNYLVEIAGLASHDRVVSENISANGTITVVLDGYAPAGGSSFDIADGAILGAPIFDFTGAVLGAGQAWDTSNFLVDGTIRVTGGMGSAYDVWADGFGLVGGKMDDDDNDGDSNLLEFATNSNPTQGGSGARYYGEVVTLGADEVLTFTVAVRSGAVFAPNGSTQEATQDQVAYTVEASDNLAAWNVVVVTELNPADSATVQALLPLPTLDAGWEWHSFRTDDTVLLDPQDMVRLSIAEAP